jgi:hypothetical protein
MELREQSLVRLSLVHSLFKQAWISYTLAADKHVYGWYLIVVPCLYIK